MSVQFTQSGGIIGITRTATLDQRDLPPDLQDVLGSILAEGRPERLDPNARDTMIYTIEIDTDSDTRKVVFDDTNVPEGARPLLEFFMERAKPASR